jgi:uncharacterized protein
MRSLHRPLLIGVLHVVQHPLRVLSIAGICVAACASLAAWKLNISSDQNKLFDPNVQFFRDYLGFAQNYPENEATYVAIQSAEPAHPPPIARWTSLADAITTRLKSMPQFVTSVDSKVPIDQLGPQGLLFDDPQRVRQSFEDVKRFIPLVKLWAEKPGLTVLLGRTPLERFLNALRTQKPSPEINPFITLLAKSWNETIEHPESPLKPGSTLPDLASLDATDPSRLGYYYVPDDSDPSRYLMLVRVYQRSDYDSLTAISETIEAIRDAAKDVAKTYPEFTVSITGRPALEADEMRTTDTDSHRAEIVAAIAIFIGLTLMLRSLWLALAGEIALAVGIAWTFGWATVSVGELNLLSVVFMLALIGIGMDYLVQILTRYRQEVARRSDPQSIWIAVFQHVALPINTACLGAAGAFFVSIFTHFRGAAQLGIIAGGGLLLCLLAGYIMLPALLTLFPLRVKPNAELPDLGPPARGGKHNLIIPLLWLFLLAAGIPFMQQTHFDPGLLTMQAPNLESVRMVRHLQTWSAVVLSKDLQTLRAARDALKDSPVVGSTESILTAYDNLQWLRDHEKELPAVQWAGPTPIESNDLSHLADTAAALAKTFTGSASDELKKFAANVIHADPNRLSKWQNAFIDQLRDSLASFHPHDLDTAALPAEMRGHYIGADGSFALYIYPKQDLWVQSNLAAFVKDVESRIVPVPGNRTLTGIALNVFHSTASIEKSFHKATIYALILILILVFIDLKSISQTLAAVSVLALGLPMLVAVMGLLGVDWNFANFFGLPILIGAGHEYGVFLVHRYREAQQDPRRPWRRWDVSDRALLLCAYVTCSSFGFFWALAHHEGLRSLGLVMALGTACIYLSALLVLRPLLVFRLGKTRNPSLAISRPFLTEPKERDAKSQATN